MLDDLLGSGDKTPNDNTQLWSNFRQCPLPSSSSLSPFDPVPVKMIGFQESLYCAADEEVLFGGDGPVVCACACVCVHPPEGSARSVRVWGAWPGLVRVQLLLSNHSEDQRPGTWSSWKYSRGMRAEREGCKAGINTKSRCHFKWLFLGGSVCANVDCVCTHVCVYTISGEEKGKEGTELILSVYQPYLSVIEFSPSSIVVVFVSGGWMVDFFFPLSGSAVLQLQQQIHSKNCLLPL